MEGASRNYSSVANFPDVRRASFFNKADLSGVEVVLCKTAFSLGDRAPGRWSMNVVIVLFRFCHYHESQRFLVLHIGSSNHTSLSFASSFIIVQTQQCRPLQLLRSIWAKATE